MMYFSVVSALALLSGVAAGTDTCVASYGDVTPATPDPVAPAEFAIRFDTNVVLSDGSPAEPIIINVTRSWAPLGADHIYSVMSDGFYNCAGFFRVVPDFVVQFGIAASPDETAKWDSAIVDDPVVKSNVPWTVTYATAGADTRTTQLFINTVDNSRLDSDGFAPFGMVTHGFDTVLAIVNPTPDSSDGVGQVEYTKLGNDWLLKKYPNISLITSGTLLE